MRSLQELKVLESELNTKLQHLQSELSGIESVSKEEAKHKVELDAGKESVTQRFLDASTLKSEWNLDTFNEIARKRGLNPDAGIPMSVSMDIEQTYHRNADQELDLSSRALKRAAKTTVGLYSDIEDSEKAREDLESKINQTQQLLELTKASIGPENNKIYKEKEYYKLKFKTEADDKQITELRTGLQQISSTIEKQQKSLSTRLKAWFSETFHLGGRSLSTNKKYKEKLTDDILKLETFRVTSHENLTEQKIEFDNAKNERDEKQHDLKQKENEIAETGHLQTAEPSMNPSVAAPFSSIVAYRSATSPAVVPTSSNRSAFLASGSGQGQPTVRLTVSAEQIQAALGSNPVEGLMTFLTQQISAGNIDPAAVEQFVADRDQEQQAIEGGLPSMALAITASA